MRIIETGRRGEGGTGRAGRAAGSLLPALCAVLALPLGAAPPTDILLASASVREHQDVGTIVGILRAVDADPGDPHTFSLVSGTGSADNALFMVSGDLLLAAATFDHSTRSSFSVRVRTRDGSGATFEKALAIVVTPPSFVASVTSHLAATPLVQAATLATFDKETADYFWVHLNSLAATGSVDVDVPAATPAATAASGAWTVALTAVEGKRLIAAKAAHAVWLDVNRLVAWRLGDYTAAQLKGLFDVATVFDPQAGAPTAFVDVVDHSPSVGYRYAVTHGLVRATALQTVQAVLDDLRSDFTHGVTGEDAQAAYTLGTALSTYVMKGLVPLRVSRAGCHSSTRITLALLRSLNVPGSITVMSDYFPPGHSTAILPSLGLVMAHGDDLYTADLTATPVDQLLVPLTYYADNPSTAPCSGDRPCLSLRHHALHGLAYPSAVILAGARSPASFGYASAAAFLAGYAGWDRGLTAAELQQAAATLATGFTDTRRLTLPASTAKGWIVNAAPATDYPKGSRVSLKAVPRAGYAFARWTGDVPAGLETANPLVLAMDVARSIQAAWSGPPIPPATPVATNDGPRCEGGNITLATAYVPGALFSWTGPNGFTSSSFSPTLYGVTPAMAGEYAVTVTIDGDTSAPGRTTVGVHPRPAPVIAAPATAAVGTTFTASVEPLAGATYAWSVVTNGMLVAGQGTPSVTVKAAALGSLQLRLTVTSAGGCVSLAATAKVTVADPTKLLLQSGRVAVKVDWRSQYSGQGGAATAIPKGDAFGYFSFFDASNPEVFVKVLDFGSASPYLLFWGGLTDFEYTVTFTSTATGASVSFHKEPGSTAGGVSTTTLPHLRAVRTSLGAPGPAGPGEILLANGQVAVSATWRSQYDGQGGAAVPIPQQDGFCFFTFFDAQNPEVFVKVLDWGAASPFKLFAAGLTDFAYAVTFRDVRTGATTVFQKAAGAYDGYVSELPR